VDDKPTHYDVLGLDPRASREQVEKAYRFCLDMYGEGAIATYSLLDRKEVDAARARIHEAYEVLSDAARRRDYDLSLGLSPPPAPLLPFPGAGEAPAAVESAASCTAPVDFDLPPGPVTGAELKRLREARGVTLREIAQVSKIGIRFLEYIEEDRFSFLPAPVYLRGFLHEYARLVGIDPKRAAEAYMSRLADKG
jgi:flagellar biosynthesis protein FlhG